MDPTKSTISQAEPSSSGVPAGKSMDIMNGSTGLRNANIPASLYLANEISPEAVMPELNMFRPTTTALPLWNGSSAVAQGMNYSIISSPSTTANTTNSPQPDSSMHSGHNGTIVMTQPAGSSNSYDVFNGANHDDMNSFNHSLSPKNSFSESGGNLSGQESGSNTDEQELDGDEGDEQNAPKRKKRTPVPDERKDAKYWARRRKNNDAAKRSRDQRRKKLDLELKSAREAITENQKLKQEIDVLKAEINSLRRLLKDANTTLSLWIRARQAAEPNVQLPPMLRGSNVSFVNFPVSSAT